jgi:hypothetical protein
MVNAVNYTMLKRMGKWAVAYIMKKDRDSYCGSFFFGDLNAFVAKRFDRLAHKVHCSNGMMEAGMQRTRINERGQTKLLDPAKTLEPGMLDKVVYNRRRNTDKAINWIIEDLSLL